MHLEARSEIAIYDLWDLLRQRRWLQALPWLAVVVGLFAMVLLIGPLLWYMLPDQRLIAYGWMALVAWTFGRLAWNISRGE